MPRELLDWMYYPDGRDEEIFGEHYIRPEGFSHGGWQKVAEFKAEGDGIPCHTIIPFTKVARGCMNGS